MTYDRRRRVGPACPHCVSDLFVIIFDHKNLRIMWRGGDESDDDLYIPPDHDSHEVITAIKDASRELYEGCRSADYRKHEDPRVETDGSCKVFRTGFININHAYTALALYAYRKRMSGRSFKLKTVTLAGELGGRGVNFKPHGFGHDPKRGRWIVEPHQGYLTDMFFMFDAVKNRQITTHGEFILQAIGRLCTLTIDAELARMDVRRGTPPRLWTSESCYNVITNFALGVQQWVAVMKSKAAGESIKDALVRNIKGDPRAFSHLYMIYSVPTTDRRWAKKDYFVRQTRKIGAEKDVGEALRAEPRMPSTPRTTHGIQHDPDTDRKRGLDKAISEAEKIGEARERGELDDEESDDSDQPQRKSQRQMRTARLPRGFVMVAKAEVVLDESIEGEFIYMKWDDDEYHMGEIAVHLPNNRRYNFDVKWSDGTHGHKLSLDKYKLTSAAPAGSWVLARRADRDAD